MLLECLVHHLLPAGLLLAFKEGKEVRAGRFIARRLPRSQLGIVAPRQMLGEGTQVPTALVRTLIVVGL